MGEVHQAFDEGAELGRQLADTVNRFLRDDLAHVVLTHVEAGIPRERVLAQTAWMLRTTADGLDPGSGGKT